MGIACELPSSGLSADVDLWGLPQKQSETIPEATPSVVLAETLTVMFKHELLTQSQALYTLDLFACAESITGHVI